MGPINKYEISNKELDILISKIALNDNEALSELYKYTSHMIYAYALSLCKDKHDAEDILQMVFIKIHESSPNYQLNGKPKAWMFTITKNITLNKLKARKDNYDIDDYSNIIHETNHNNHLVDELFNRLSDEERNIIIMHLFYGYKFHEISKINNINLSTVLSKYRRSIKKLKKIYMEEYL